MSARCDKCGCLLEPGDDFRCIDCWNEEALAAEAEAESEAPRGGMCPKAHFDWRTPKPQGGGTL